MSEEKTMVQQGFRPAQKGRRVKAMPVELNRFAVAKS
jgi:hypothetical protein